MKKVVVRGIRTPRPYSKSDRPPYETEVELSLRKGFDDNLWVEVTKGGVTGYEGAQLSALQAAGHRGWSACAGCAAWDRLEISAEELQKALKELTK